MSMSRNQVLCQASLANSGRVSGAGDYNRTLQEHRCIVETGIDGCVIVTEHHRPYGEIAVARGDVV